jgi:glycosyltransferase involved in cell wall biosynthesis
MRICIDARSPGTKGILSVMVCLIRSLLKLDQKNEYTIINDPNHESWGDEKTNKIVVPSLNPVRWIVWSNTILPQILEKNKVDIYHSLKHVTALRLKAKKIVTFHGGPTLYRHPEFYKRHDLIYWKLAYSLAVRKYDKVITGAEAEKRYFVEKLKFPDSKFCVTHLAADNRFRLLEGNDKLQTIKQKHKLHDPFVLFVGQIHPRKNLEGVIKGYHKAIPQLTTKHKLVIVGDSNSAYFGQISDLVQQLSIKEDVVFLGHIPEDDLPYVYNLADLFLFPSHYESFGIVFLEAMACGLPVIAPNIEDIDEVVGDAALRVDAKSAVEIAEAIVKVLNCDEVRRSLIERGLGRARLFSWDRCARETIGVYEALTNS